jgi:hypothetical protein
MTAKGGWKKTACCCWVGARRKFAHATVETVADPEAQQGTEDVAEQKTEEGAKHLTPNTHGSDLVKLMSASLQLLVQRLQPRHRADVAPLAGQQAAAHPALRHPVAQQRRQLRAPA